MSDGTCTSACKLQICTVCNHNTRLLCDVCGLLFIRELSRMSFPNKKVDTEILKRRPKTRSCALIWSLPAELLLHLFKGLQIKDLLNLCSVTALSVLIINK